MIGCSVSKPYIVMVRCRGIGSKGMTGWVPYCKGIRQGCPMSPTLFALYTTLVMAYLSTIPDLRQNEPAMLMYADDMLIWGQTEEEVQHEVRKSVRSL